MSVDPLLVLFALVSLGIVALVAVALVRNHRQSVARTAALEAKGWRYTTTPRGFTVEGGDTVPWTLTLSRPRSSGSSTSGGPHTKWETAAEPTEAVVLVGPKLPAVLASMSFGGSLVQMALRAILGDEARDLATAREVELGSPAFRERFTVIASSEALATELLDDTIQQALLAGPPNTAVLRWRDRLELRVSRGVWDPEEIAAVVALGERVAQRCGFGQ